MEIPILITGDDATGYTATDCFGRMVQAGTRVDVQTKMMGFLRREILGGSLSILHADGSIPFVPAARSENSNSEGFKLWQEGIAEARREEDMSEARDAQRTSPELVEWEREWDSAYREAILEHRRQVDERDARESVEEERLASARERS